MRIKRGAETYTRNGQKTKERMQLRVPFHILLSEDRNFRSFFQYAKITWIMCMVFNIILWMGDLKAITNWSSFRNRISGWLRLFVSWRVWVCLMNFRRWFLNTYRNFFDWFIWRFGFRTYSIQSSWMCFSCFSNFLHCRLRFIMVSADVLSDIVSVILYEYLYTAGMKILRSIFSELFSSYSLFWWS